jgi:hypothetical protein
MKKDRKIMWGIVLFCVGAAILLLTFYYSWWTSYHVAADIAAGNVVTADNIFPDLVRYFGYIIGGALVVSAVYIILACI